MSVEHFNSLSPYQRIEYLRKWTCCIQARLDEDGLQETISGVIDPAGLPSAYGTGALDDDYVLYLNKATGVEWFWNADTTTWIEKPSVAGGTVQPTDGNALNIRAADEGLPVGDARGTESFDTQTSRTVSTQAATGAQSVLVGGTQNTASGAKSVVVGGINNEATNIESVVVGGDNNTATGQNSSVLGGVNNDATGTQSAIGGGSGNVASGNSATIGGGFSHIASGATSTIAGGDNNEASGDDTFIGGGEDNVAGPLALSVVTGGFGNTASHTYVFVGGGNANTASATRSAIVGGDTNTASGDYAFIGGGRLNTASGDYAVVPGGISNTADAIYSWAGGRRAKVGGFAGAFVWADSTSADFTAIAADTFNIRADGLRLVDGNEAAGKVLTSDANGTGTWQDPGGGADVLAYTTSAISYTVLVTDAFVKMTGSGTTATLPTAVGIAGQKFAIKNYSGGAVTVDGNGAETIDGALTYATVDKENLVVVSDGANWMIY